MEKDVLQLITQALTEGRITEKVHQSEEYNKAKEDETRTYDLLTEDLTDDQKKRLDDYIDSMTWSAAIWEKLAYQQGMKDFLSLLISLS